MRRTELGMIKNVYWSLCKVQYSYSCQIVMKLEFSRKIFEKYSNLIKIRPVGAELFFADGRTDRMTKLIVAFRNFAKASKNP